jgi:feruloyl esterase
MVQSVARRERDAETPYSAAPVVQFPGPTWHGACIPTSMVFVYWNVETVVRFTGYALRMLAVVTLLVVQGPAWGKSSSCDSLAQLSLPGTSITLAEMPDLGKPPSYCRVLATLRPTDDSEIKVEIRLPPEGSWNGKFLAVGSGGWGGGINTGGLEEALRRGYATAATNDGHDGGSADFIMGHPQKFIDFAYRAEHGMTVTAKALIRAFYGRPARYSYWQGCSGGGREGLLQAYRYPTEFDGIIAGDPANIRRNTWMLWIANQTRRESPGFIPAAKYPMIHRAVLDKCDADDGLRDGLIEAPESCQFDFKTLACPGASGPDCLTAAQVRTAEIMVSTPTNSAGVPLLPHLEPGTELAWERVAGVERPGDLFLDQFRYVVYQDPNWDWRSFDLDHDFARANAVDHDVDEVDPHLAAFVRHGGKLLIFHGWADQQVLPGFSVDFYRETVRSTPDAQRAAPWIRLYMVPGMGHCGGGEGPDTFDTLAALEQWVERGKAPEHILASQLAGGHVVRTRPLCPYPQIARYLGSGDVDDAANFTCR